MPYFHNEGFRMHYEVHRGMAPVDTLFVHGNLGSNRWWEPLLKSWERQFAAGDSPRQPGALIFAEWRGCGKSSGPQSESDLEFPVLALDYVELLQSLGIQRANIVGHSTGGLIALHALKLVPGLFGRAVLLDPVSAQGVAVSPTIVTRFIQMNRDRALLGKSLARAIRGCDTSTPFFSGLVDDALAAHPLAWVGLLRKFSLIDFRPSLREIPQPTLVLHGEHDRMLPIEGSIEIANGLPEGRFELLPGQGHSCHVENPERFARLTQHFLYG